MKMNNPVICCEECFKLIAKKDEAAAHLWLDLCTLQDECKFFGLCIDDHPYLKTLESLGFILTTDSEDMILVKVLGKKVNEIGSVFCGGKCGS